MKNTQRNYLLLVLLSVFASTQSSSFTNNGRFVSKKAININLEETFDGVGYLEAPIITISAKKFAYTGTISCSELCIIQAEEGVDPTMFTAEGLGDFVLIDNSLIQPIIVKLSPADSFEEIHQDIPLDKRKKWFNQSVLSFLVELECSGENTLSDEEVYAAIKYIKRCVKAFHLKLSSDISVAERKGWFDLCISPFVKELENSRASISDERVAKIVDSVEHCADRFHVKLSTDIALDERKRWFDLCVYSSIKELVSNYETIADDRVKTIVEHLLEWGLCMRLPEDYALQQLRSSVEKKLADYSGIDRRRKEGKRRALTIGIGATLFGITLGYLTSRSLKYNSFFALFWPKYKVPVEPNKGWMCGLSFKEKGATFERWGCLIAVTALGIGSSWILDSFSGQDDQAYEKFFSIRDRIELAARLFQENLAS